jgi:C4-dicarboxylate-specific signal transduction histidine kinase
MPSSPADSLHRRYHVALAVIAVLALLHQVLIQPALLRLTTDAPVINIAGRQRMLSQRLAKAALALDRSDQDAPDRVSELKQVLALWSASHEALKHGDRAFLLPGRTSSRIRAAFLELEPVFRPTHDAALRLANRRPEERASPDDLATILRSEGTYLERMDGIVGLFEREARDRVSWLFWTGWVLTGLIWIALLAIERFILDPALNVIARQVELLRHGRDELEERVRERTLELATATQRHRALLEQFSHAARTKTIGEMATGLAHELNQPLGAIANYAEGCLVELASPRPAVEEVKTALRKLLDTTMRAGHIIDRIRKFVNRKELRRESFSANRVVTEVDTIIRQEVLNRGVAFKLDLASDLPKLCGDAVQIQQVLVNLVQNALDSIAAAKPLCPSILIQTRPAECHGVEFLVTDNGEGIRPELLGQVFEAYFSTRASGMGMGLAISRAIIEAHQGRISVASPLVGMTTFRFTLPGGCSDGEGSNGLHHRR